VVHRIYQRYRSRRYKKTPDKAATIVFWGRNNQMFRTGLTIIRCHREPTTEVIVAVRRAVSHFKCLLGTVRPRLAASIITQILQHALRTQAKPLRLAPDPIQQQHSPGIDMPSVLSASVVPQVQLARARAPIGCTVFQLPSSAL
jgi:hypothetical protein